MLPVYVVSIDSINHFLQYVPIVDNSTFKYIGSIESFTKKWQAQLN